MADREKYIKVLSKAVKTVKEFNEDTPIKISLEFAEDILELLKEQEGIVPYIDIDEAKCPVCKVKLTRQELLGDDVLFEDFFDYCPHCGKPVLWKGR